MRIELIKRIISNRLPKAGDADPTNLCWHSDRGKEAFWATIQGILSAIQHSTTSTQEELLESLYYLIVKERQKEYEAKLHEIDPGGDRAMAVPFVWLALGWDNEARLINLPTIEKGVNE